MTRRRRRDKSYLLTILFAAVPIVLCAGMAAIVWPFLKHDEEQIPFDLEEWHGPMTDADGRFTGTRLAMVEDLLGQYDFHGWGEVSVRAMLGEPMRERTDGATRFVAFDLRDGLNLLIFEMNEQNRVVDYTVQRE